MLRAISALIVFYTLLSVVWLPLFVDSQGLCASDSRGIDAVAVVGEPGSCTAGVSNLAYTDTLNVSTAACNLNHVWDVERRLIAPNLTLEGVVQGSFCALSDEPVVLQYQVLVDDNELLEHYGFSGEFGLNLTNNGDCDASVVSVVLLFERALDTPAESAFSYGVDKESYLLMGSLGVESSVTDNCLDLDPFSKEAVTCLDTCSIQVPYEAHQIYNIDTGAPLNLDNLLIAADGGGIAIPLRFEFKLSSEQLASMLGNPTATYRMSALVTYDGCCPSQGACAIDYNCDGTSDTLTTVQLRSPAITWPLYCSEMCSCIKVTEDNTTSVISPTNECFSFDGMISDVNTPRTICSDFISHIDLTGGCCTCDTEVHITNSVRVGNSFVDSCTNVLGVSLIRNTVAVLDTKVSCVAPPFG